MKTELEMLEIIKEQEKALVFPKLDVDTVVSISRILSERLRKENAPGYVLASVNRCTVYAEALPGSLPDNAEWTRRKGNTAMLYNKSSFRVGIEMRSKGKDLSTRGLPLFDYCLAGGAVPIKVGDLTVGFIAASGTNQIHEHQAVCDAMASYFGVEIGSVLD